MVLRYIIVGSQHKAPLGGIIQPWTWNKVAGKRG